MDKKKVSWENLLPKKHDDWFSGKKFVSWYRDRDKFIDILKLAQVHGKIAINPPGEDEIFKIIFDLKLDSLIKSYDIEAISKSISWRIKKPMKPKKGKKVIEGYSDQEFKWHDMKSDAGFPITLWKFGSSYYVGKNAKKYRITIEVLK